MTNEAEERAAYLLREAMACAVRMAMARHNLELDPDAATEEEIAYDAAGACFGEECCDDKPIAEVAELLTLAARAASPVSAPVTLDQAREWRRINWYDSVPEMLDKALAAFANYAANGVAPVSAEPPAPMRRITQPWVIREDLHSACCAAPVMTGDDDVCTKCNHPCSYEMAAAPSVASEDSATQPVQTCTRPAPHICKVNGPCNGWPSNGITAPEDCYVAYCRYTERGTIVTCDSDAPKAFKVYRHPASRPGSEDWMRKAAKETVDLKLASCWQSVFAVFNKHYAASQLSTEKK